jgi:heat shock protein HslJ
MKKILLIIILAIIAMDCKTAAIQKNNNYKKSLEGEWTLDYIEDIKREHFSSRAIPFIKINPNQNIVSGNDGCNAFIGKINITGNKIEFKEPMTSTKMYCQDIDETLFMKNLFKTEIFSISTDGKKLKFLKNGVLLIQFIKN